MAVLKGYRLRRGPVVVLLALVGAVGSLAILAGQLRPGVEVYAPVVVEAATLGTTYAVDEQVCLRAAQVAAEVREVEVAGGGGADLRVVLPPRGRPPVIAFPVDPEAGRPVEGAVVPARRSLCLRLLLSGEERGELRAPAMTVRVRYGPLGVFFRDLTVRPPTTLEVTGSGTDPRLREGAAGRG